jgi:hypothetical protein
MFKVWAPAHNKIYTVKGKYDWDEVHDPVHE